LKLQLNPLEARVIGVLVEKEITTPDQYPLSLNALTNGCNQKSNREPVMDLSEAVVQETVDRLIKKHLARSHSGFGSRVSKYQHRFFTAEFGELKLSPQELAVMCELMLRGPQTPGELRSRAERMARFTDVEHVERTLNDLMERGVPLVARLPRQPGKREARFTHLVGDEAFPIEEDVATAGSVSADQGGHGRIDALERTVAELQTQMTKLEELVEMLIDSGSKAS
jgi:uncharacterized protein YceH (UPF0502 family)